MQSQTIDSDEIILRRIKPPAENVETVQIRSDGRLRATSFSLKFRPGVEEGISFSRLKQTSPSQLLQLLRNQGQSSDGWLVCWLRVSEVESLGLQVIHLPTDEDPGHCEIRATETQPFTNTLFSKLAKKTIVLTDEEIKSIAAGDSL